MINNVEENKEPVMFLNIIPTEGRLNKAGPEFKALSCPLFSHTTCIKWRH